MGRFFILASPIGWASFECGLCQDLPPHPEPEECLPAQCPEPVSNQHSLTPSRHAPLTMTP